MKTVTKLSILLLVVLLTSPVINLAQNVGFEKEFSFNKDSKKETFTFEVKEGTKELVLDLEGVISTGSLKVKIINPEGNQVSGFSLKTSKNHSRTFSYDLDSDSRKEQKKEKTEKVEKDKKEAEEVREVREVRETRTEVREAREVRETRAEARSVRASARSNLSSTSSSSKATASSSGSGSSVSVSVETDESGHSVTKTNKTHIYTKEKTETSEPGARGVINKEITNPASGTWEFIIYPDDAEGKLSAKIMYK